MKTEEFSQGFLGRTLRHGSKKKRVAMFMKESIAKVISVFVIVLVSASSAVFLYEKKEKIINKLMRVGTAQHDNRSFDAEWSQKLNDGGYILHFRHAERDKWIDVKLYDAIESDMHENGPDGTLFAENEDFADAVCLNARGKIQAAAMGKTLKYAELPIGLVVSSVSCRARQTADLAFGGYSSMNKLLVHDGPYLEDDATRLQNLVQFYSNLEIVPNTNTVVSAHNGVIRCEMFINCRNKYLSLEEGGFYVISQRDEGLYLEHEYNNFQHYMLTKFLR